MKRTVSKKSPRLYLGRVLLLLAPLMLLAMVELGLRLFSDLGGYEPVFMKIGEVEEGTLYTTSNKGASTYFYAKKGKPGTMMESLFLMPKPQKALRIFIAGGSAAEGFPYPYASGLGNVLELMLEQVLERECEVINISTTAISCYPAVSMAIDSLEFEPDAVILYSGNNEFFGAYGRASSHPLMFGSPSLQRRLNGLAILQGLRKLQPDIAGGANKLLIEGMMGKTYIAPDDPMRDKLQASYRKQLQRLEKATKAKGLPLLVCTLPANERDMAPYGEPELAEGVPIQDERLTFKEAKGLLEYSPKHSLANYVVGKQYLEEGREELARKHFRAALDYDTLPWRAPNVLSQIVREEASLLCDLQKVFREQSPAGLVGWELMIDHVHPNAEGQILAAQAMAKTLLPILSPSSDVQKLDQVTRNFLKVGIPAVEAYIVDFQMAEFLKVSFFSRYNPEVSAYFQKRAEKLAKGLPPPLVTQLQGLAQQQKLHLRNRPASAFAGFYYMSQKDFSRAIPLFSYALQCAHPTSDDSKNYAFAFLSGMHGGGRNLAPEQLDFVKKQVRYANWRAKLHSESGTSSFLTARMCRLVGLKKEAYRFYRLALEAGGISPDFVKEAGSFVSEKGVNEGRSSLPPNDN